jgi:hypothetical protein
VGTLDDEVYQGTCAMMGLEAGLADSVPAGMVDLESRGFMAGNGAPPVGTRCLAA